MGVPSEPAEQSRFLAWLPCPFRTVYPDTEIAMKKVKTSVFLLIGVLVHFGLTAAIVGSRLACDAQVHCISPLNEAAGSILSLWPSTEAHVGGIQCCPRPRDSRQ